MIGPAIKFQMELLCVNNVELQKRLGFKYRSQVTELLKPESNPKWSTIINVAKALDVSVKTLVVTFELLGDGIDD